MGESRLAKEIRSQGASRHVKKEKGDSNEEEKDIQQNNKGKK